MEQLDIFGGEICEYLFVIDPDKKTSETLIQLRTIVSSMIPLSEKVIHSKPHISLCDFTANEFSDEHILSKAIQALSSMKSFDIHIEGPERWQNGILVLKIIPDTNTLELQALLSTVFKRVTNALHLTIARNIPDKSMKQIPIENFRYKGDFKCETISILKKRGNQPYQVLDRIYLKPEYS